MNMIEQRVTPLTLEQVKASMPKARRKTVNQESVDILNAIDRGRPELIGSFKDNFIMYGGVLESSKNTVEEYINAVLFVSYINLRCTEIDSYIKVFPERYERLTKELGMSRDKVSQYASRYKAGKLVSSIIAQTVVAPWILNMGVFQEAINVQADLMLNAKSELVRQKAADSLMDKLAPPPEDKTINLRIGRSDEDRDATKRMTDQIENVAKNMQMLIANGKSVEEVQVLNLVHGDIEEGEIL